MKNFATARTLLVRAGSHVFWTHPMSGAAREYVEQESEERLFPLRGAPATSLMRPGSTASAPAATQCESHLWIG